MVLKQQMKKPTSISDMFEAVGFYQVERKMIEKPPTFEHFPPDTICPVCGSKEDAECILLRIDGTEKDDIMEAAPCHLWCAIATNFNRNVNVIYKRIE